MARIKLGLQDELRLGNLDARRDWGYAPEYVEATWRMLQGDEARDYVIGTGEQHSPAEFVEIAFAHVGLNHEDYVRHDASLVTTVEPLAPCGNPAKAKRLLGWENATPFPEIVPRLVDSELNKLN